MDRAYIDYEKFQQLTERGVIYVTKMKKSLKYTVSDDMMYYVDLYSLFNNPEKDWEIMLLKASGAPPEPSLFD